MNFQTKAIVTSAIALAGTVAAVAPSFAGEAYVTNSYSTRNITNGYSYTKVDADIKDVSNYSELTKALKMESYGGTLNISQVNFNGSNMTGFAHSSNQVVVDPVAIGAYSESYTTGTRTEVVKVDSLNTYNFTGRDNSHTVSAGVKR